MISGVSVDDQVGAPRKRHRRPNSAAAHLSRGIIASLRLCPWQVTLFLFALILPVTMSFYVGPLRLTLYRAFLIVAFLPCLVRLCVGRCGRAMVSDVLMACYVGWAFLAMAVNHGFDMALESGGIYVLEGFGAYMVGRCFLRNAKEFQGFAAVLTVLVIVLSLFTIPESLTGWNPLSVGPTEHGKRLGMHRAFVSFGHPIIYGVFCASAVSLSWFALSPTDVLRPARILRTGGTITSTFMSFSSGPLAAVLVQLLLIGWDRVSRRRARRWLILGALFAIVWFVISITSNRTPMKVLLSYFTFSPATAYTRLTIWEWGTKYNVAEHPLFGIGFSEWIRPVWMHSTSMDNFWLVVMVMYGLPAFMGLAGAIVYQLIRLGRQLTGDYLDDRCRKAWMFSMIGLVLAGGTVHFWNSLFVYFCFLVGAGTWMCRRPSLKLINSRCVGEDATDAGVEAVV
jgi:hypothetical protein